MKKIYEGLTDYEILRSSLLNLKHSDGGQTINIDDLLIILNECQDIESFDESLNRRINTNEWMLKHIHLKAASD